MTTRSSAQARAARRRVQIPCGGRGLAVAVLGLGAVAGPVEGQCQYEVAAVLQYPINCSTSIVITTGTARNDHGTVVGFWYCPLWDDYEAFVWTPEGGFTTLQRPPGTLGAQARDINNHGVICGDMVVEGVGYRGFVWEDGQWTILPTVTGAGWSSANAINDAGQVVGARAIAGDTAPINAFIWTREGGFLDLGVMDGPSSAARDINEGGEVVGWTGSAEYFNNTRGFVWRDGELTEIGIVPGGWNTVPWGLNEHGHVVGRAKLPVDGLPIPSTYHAFLWADGLLTDLGVLEGYNVSMGQEINDLGQIVGMCRDLNSGGLPDRGFIINPGGPMIDLNSLLEPGAGVVVRYAGHIYNDGMILGNTGWTQTVTSGQTVLLRPTEVRQGDLTGDCRVDIIDLLRLLSSWGEGDLPADLDGDGIVGGTDLEVLIANWG